MTEAPDRTPLVTIAICTYNRALFLRTALESLLQQSLSTDEFCVLVVDNASTDDTQKVIAEMGPRFAHFESVHEGCLGLSHARNAAVTACRTSWLAFLDDDAKARSDWASVMLDVIRQDVFDCFGGVFLPWYHFGPPPPWFDEKTATNKDTQYFMGLLPEDECPAGGNCAYRTSFFGRCGNFSAILGMQGSAPGYGEENEVIKRFRDGGARVGFVPHMLIDHCVLPHKYTVKWRVQSIFAQGRAHYHVAKPAAHISPLRWLWGWAKACVKLIVQFCSPWRHTTWAEAFLVCVNGPLHYSGILYEHYRGRRC